MDITQHGLALVSKISTEENVSGDALLRAIRHYGTLVDWVVARRASLRRSVVLGICGSQGSGKSTLARILKEILVSLGDTSVAVLSLDDLYLSRAERERLARQVHPLLRTRGVPGTHDTTLGVDIIQKLRAAGARTGAQLPRFDKRLDEPLPVSAWEAFHGRPDVILFEGWCVGARPQASAALEAPVNELERTHDPAGIWRRFVNNELAGRYQTLFAMLDALLMIRAPSFDVVLEWRREQERKLAARSTVTVDGAATRIMRDDELEWFVMHYERLTRHILQEMPQRADIRLDLNARREIMLTVCRDGAACALSG